MSEHTASTLSALMDDEASELDLRRSLKELADDPEQQQRWKRYQAARAVMQSQPTEFLQLDISSAVSSAIADEESYKTQAPGKGVLRPFAGFAVAASVAAAVFLAGPVLQNGGQVVTEPQVAQQNFAPVQQSALPVIGPAGAQQVSQGSSAAEAPMNAQELQQMQLRRAKLNAYMSIYAQQAALNSNSGMLPLARHAGYSPE
jgi:sigma-E factor negative regulatory protein RseA